MEALEVVLPFEADADAPDFGLLLETEAAALFAALEIDEAEPTSFAPDATFAVFEGLVFCPKVCPASLAPLVWDGGCALA